MKLTRRQQKSKEFLSSIYAKARLDNSFKQQLINSPIETLNKFTGKVGNIPPNRNIVVQDQTNPNHIYLNIPAKPNLDDLELSDEQFEKVSGGTYVDLNFGFLPSIILAFNRE